MPNLTRMFWNPSNSGAKKPQTPAAAGGNSFYPIRQNLPANAPSPHFQLRDDLDAYKSQLGLFDKLWTGRQTKVEIRRVYGELIVNYLEHQKEKLIFQMTVNLSDEKKRILSQSLIESGRIDQEIAKLSTEFDAVLIDFMEDAALDSYDAKAVRIERLTERHEAGRLSDADYAIEMRYIEEWQTTFRENLNAKIILLMENHAGKIQRALALFQERHFGGALS